MKRASLAVPVALLALLVAACAPEDETEVSSSSSTSGADGISEAGACAPADLPTLTDGVLTFGTDEPAYGPWFSDDDPTNGEGYEAAVAYAVAEQMGYDEGTVEWVRVPFNTAIAPGPKTFDVDINQFTITDERRQAVDFSSPYYEVTQVAITTAGSAADGVTTLEELSQLRLGAQVGTTSWDAAAELLGSDPETYNDNDVAKTQLVNGAVDAIVVDLPTAFYITGAELDDGVIVGQIPSAGGEAEEFGMVLDLDSPLTDCVSTAVDALREDGTLDELQQQWLADVAGAVVLE